VDLVALEGFDEAGVQRLLVVYGDVASCVIR
jgi:hypothetical protein